MGKRFLTEGKLRKRRVWAMLLLGGFAGIGFMAYRLQHRRKL